MSSIDKFGRRGQQRTKKILLRGPPGVGFAITKDGHFDIQNKRLQNIANPVDGADAVPLEFFYNYMNVSGEEVNNALFSITEDLKKLNEVTKYNKSEIERLRGHLNNELVVVMK